MAVAQRKDLHNFAIIAHVDHGKTTLVDAILKQTGVFRTNEHVIERMMDSNDLEKERGITIFSKNASYQYKGAKFNIVDTPGHADFGGEVERILKMVDGVLLLVDAAEGPLPQTRFVLKKSLALGHKPIVVINKIDRHDARPHEVHSMVLDLFISLEATDEQAEFPYLFACSRAGTCRLQMEDLDSDLRPLLDMIAAKVPGPVVDQEAPFQMLVSNILYNEFVGRIAVGRVARGRVDKTTPLVLMKENKNINGRTTKLLAFEGMKQVEVDGASAGDIVGLAGFEDVFIGDTLCAADSLEALERIHVDEPTLSMTFGVNTSPFGGQEGKFVTARHLKNRLERELLSNLALRVDTGEGEGSFVVSGRGELHLGILIETMRREGFELEVGKPRVIMHRDENGKLKEPYERLIIDMPSTVMGGVLERLGSRKAEMLNMTPFGDNQVRVEFSIPSRCLLGFRTDFMTQTRGEGALHHVFDRYDDFKGDVETRHVGVMWATDPGESNAYGMFSAQERGVMFIEPGEKIYAGMIVGEHARENDLGVNICRAKQLTNMRASGTDDALTLTPSRKLSLEQCLEYIADDELVEVTPKTIRLRKKILDPNERKKAEKSRGDKAKAQAGK
ncbi:MAG TPA: translational GTPase TypA [bacterium]|jgi:GTP-binding protein|nr:translational GTPase TypA [bacterium]